MKNVKISKKLLSLLTAGMLFAMPISANANDEKNEDSNENSFKLVQQVKEKTPITMAEYSLGIQNAYAYLSQFIGYDNMQADLQCLYYLINREYIPSDMEEELIDRGIVFETNFTEQKFENFMRAYNLINVIGDYNQSTIRHTDDSDKMIDVSELCYDENDSNLVHDMHMNYFNAYQNGRFYNDDYVMVFKQLTTLNAAEGAGNSHELSVGARWIALNSIGGGVMQMLRDDMQEDFTRKELDQYFDKAELNKGQWILRNDKSLDLNCLENELEVEVFNFGELWTFVYDTVNNDIMKSFEIDCAKRK